MPEQFIGIRRLGVANDNGGTPGSFGNQFQIWHQGRILGMSQEQPVAVALNNCKNVIQLMGDSRGDMSGWVKYLVGFKQQSGYFLRDLIESHGSRKATYAPASGGNKI